MKKIKEVFSYIKNAFKHSNKLPLFTILIWEVSTIINLSVGNYHVAFLEQFITILILFDIFQQYNNSLWKNAVAEECVKILEDEMITYRVEVAKEFSTKKKEYEAKYKDLSQEVKK